MVYGDPIPSLSDIKESIDRHVPSTVEHPISCFQMVADNGGRKIERALYTFVDYLYILNKAMIRHREVVFETHFFFLNKIPIILFCHYPIFR